jgi:hypothetical protein
MTHDDAETIRRAYEVWNESGPATVTERLGGGRRLPRGASRGR